MIDNGSVDISAEEEVDTVRRVEIRISQFKASQV